MVTSLRLNSVAVPAPVRVLHIINGEDYSGAERVQDLLALSLGAWGYRVGFACIVPGQFAAVRRSKQAPLHETPMRSRFDLRPIARLARLIRREKYALVHTHSVRAALVGRPAAELAGVPLIHHMHCQTSTEVHRVWKSHFQAALERVALIGAAGIVAVSQSQREYLLRRGYPSHKTWLVPNGVPSRGALSRRRETSEDFVLGALAMFRPRKGIESLLEALAILRSQGLPVRLRAVGKFQTADYERQIRQHTARLGLEHAVDWVGFQRDVSSELARMDCLILPSLVAEAMPMSVLEAMSAGVVVVGSRVEGITDLVRDGETGLIIEPNDPRDMARVLAKLIHGEVDAQAIRAKAHQRQSNHYSDRSMAAGIARIYQSVLPAHGVASAEEALCELQ